MIGMYKKFLRNSLILFTLLLSFSSCDNDDEWESDHYLYPEMEMWFNYLCSPELGGRYSGSDGIKRAEKYICDIIGRSDSLVCDVFPTSKCEMTNIIFHIEGKNDSLIVIGAHYDAYGFASKTPLPGADDNLSGVSVLLNAIKKLQSGGVRPYYSVDFCFFDGEEIGRYGSIHYLENCKRNIKTYINIDTCGNPYSTLTLGYSQYSPELKEKFVDMKKQLNLSIVEYNPVGYTTDCEPFEKARIPFVSIVCDVLPYYLHSYSDVAENISFSRLDNISNALVCFLQHN